MTYQIFPCDCIDAMNHLMEAGSVQTCVTSPPYFGLRDYGHDGQIGLEDTPDAYVARIVEVFRAVRRVLADDGTLWLNLGDSYSRSPAKGGSGPNGKNESKWGYGSAQNAKDGSSDKMVGRGDRPGTRTGGLGEKQLLGIPWRVAFALQADGWYLRQDIIWHKPNPMPESVRDRCTKSHEYIFLFSKRPRYYFDSDAIKEPAVGGWNGSQFHTGKTATHQLNRASVKRGGFSGKTGDAAFRAVTETRNKRSVWTVTTKPFKGAHFATFPPDLIEPCILAGSRPGDTVLDPFGGAGTTALVAERHGRNSVLCELNPEYVAIAEGRLA